MYYTNLQSHEACQYSSMLKELAVSQSSSILTLIKTSLHQKHASH